MPSLSPEARTRLLMGSALALVMAGVLLGDQYLDPYYPCLLALVLLLGSVGCWEMRTLMPAETRPATGLCLAAVWAVLLANWPAHLLGAGDIRAWRDVLMTFQAVVLLGFTVEVIRYRGERGAVARLGLLLLQAAYLGLLPSFLVQLRWWPGQPEAGVAALALVVFVPKGGDIGAYIAGRALGRHRMTPLLSPKKTWEGLAGGLLASAGVAVLLYRYLPPTLLHSDREALVFGLAVGAAGVVGDLAESLLKREGQYKDASQAVPGFGGVLDVIDSVLFAAPVAWWWLRGW